MGNGKTQYRQGLRHRACHPLSQGARPIKLSRKRLRRVARDCNNMSHKLLTSMSKSAMSCHLPRPALKTRKRKSRTMSAAALRAFETPSSTESRSTHKGFLMMSKALKRAKSSANESSCSTLSESHSFFKAVASFVLGLRLLPRRSSLQ